MVSSAIARRVSAAPQNQMQLRVNGESRQVPSALTVRALLEWLGLTTDRVAVEVNAEVVTRARHAERVLKPGDEVEVVTFVGGG